MSKVLSVEQIQKKIDDIESRYYKGWTQSEEWWRINGDVTTTDRRLWVYYHNLLNKRKVDLMLEKHKESVLKKAHNQLQDMYEPIAKIISDEKEKEIILTLIQDLSDKLLDNIEERKNENT
jgi:hypothetical protein